jgi:hypothetical protein
MFPPEFEEQVTSDGDSNHGGAAYISIVHYGADICGMFLHGRGALAHAGVAVAAQVGQDQAMARGQGFGYGQPEFMVNREWMQQYDRGTVAEGPIEDVCVDTSYALRRLRFHAGIKTQNWWR